MERMETAVDRARKKRAVERLARLWKVGTLSWYGREHPLTFKLLSEETKLVVFLTLRDVTFDTFPTYFIAERKTMAMRKEGQFLGAVPLYVLYCMQDKTYWFISLNNILKSGERVVMARKAARTHRKTVTEDTEWGYAIPRAAFRSANEMAK